MSKPAVFRVSENFTIRKIDPKHIAVKFFKGEYVNRTLPETKIKTAPSGLKIGKYVGNSLSSEVYSFKDKGNNHQTVYTTNHALYEYMSKKNSGEISELPILKCKYCKRNIRNDPVGLPISMQIEGDELYFTVIDNFCDFGCAFSFLKRKNGINRLYRGPLYENAEQMLHAMYYRVYPEKVGEMIRDKDDWDLLRENGGPLTDEEFDYEASIYVPIPSVNITPVKKQYFKIVKK